MKRLKKVYFIKEVVIDMDGEDLFFVTELEREDVNDLGADEVGVLIVSESDRGYIVPWSNVASCEVVL